jgi:hypothetical protein
MGRQLPVIFVLYICPASVLYNKSLGKRKKAKDVLKKW